MSHHVATLQSAFDKTASALNFAYALADRLYWLDDNYVQLFYAWAAPRLRDAAISGLYWALLTLIDIILWLIDTTSQFMARDAHAIALVAFARAHEPLPEFPALPPAPVALALPSMVQAPVFPPVVPMGSAPEALDDATPVLTLCPSVVPMAFNQSDESIRCWLTSTLPLVSSLALVDAPVVAEDVEDLPVLPALPMPKSRRAKGNAGMTEVKTPRKRLPKTQKTTAAG